MFSWFWPLIRDYVKLEQKYLTTIRSCFENCPPSQFKKKIFYMRFVPVLGSIAGALILPEELAKARQMEWPLYTSQIHPIHTSRSDILAALGPQLSQDKPQPDLMASLNHPPAPAAGSSLTSSMTSLHGLPQTLPLSNPLPMMPSNLITQQILAQRMLPPAVLSRQILAHELMPHQMMAPQILAHDMAPQQMLSHQILTHQMHPSEPAFGLLPQKSSPQPNLVSSLEQTYSQEKPKSNPIPSPSQLPPQGKALSAQYPPLAPGARGMEIPDLTLPYYYDRAFRLHGSLDLPMYYDLAFAVDAPEAGVLPHLYQQPSKQQQRSEALPQPQPLEQGPILWEDPHPDLKAPGIHPLLWYGPPPGEAQSLQGRGLQQQTPPDEEDGLQQYGPPPPQQQVPGLQRYGPPPPPQQQFPIAPSPQ